ncbi:MAG: InlB B-repeat-containing protein, partial [Prevotella sp.]
MKKKALLLLTVLFSLFGSARAQEVSFDIPSQVSAQRGALVPVTIGMNNSLRIGGWSLQFLLPEGVSLAVDEDGFYRYEISRAKKLAVDDAQTTSEGGYQISAATPAGAYFSGQSGEVLTFYLQVDSNVPLGTTKIVFKKMNFSSEGNISHEQDDVEVPMKIYELYNISAVTGNADMGAVELVGGGEETENGTTVVVTANPNEGYEFVNWTVGESVKSVENPYSFTASESVALTANFKAKKYDVTFDVDGQKTTQNLDFGSAIPTPATPAKTGYTFIGWEPAFVENATVPVDGVTYEAKWQINQYTITFDTDGGSEVAAITADYN